MMKSKIGIVIIVIAFIGSMIPYWLIFTVPAFLIGVFLIWLGNNNIRTKILLSVLPVFFWYPAFWLFMFLNGTIGTALAQKLEFRFPENFKGSVAIVSNMPCGQDVIKEDGREVLNVPQNGILLYKGKIKDGWVNHIYKINNNGALQQLKSLTRWDFDSANTKYSRSELAAFLGETGSSVLNNYTPLFEYNVQMLRISSWDSLNTYYDLQYDRNFNNLLDSLVKKCVTKR